MIEGLEISREGDDWVATLNGNYTARSYSLEGLLSQIKTLPTVRSINVQEVVRPEGCSSNIAVVVNVVGGEA